MVLLKNLISRINQIIFTLNLIFTKVKSLNINKVSKLYLDVTNLFFNKNSNYKTTKISQQFLKIFNFKREGNYNILKYWVVLRWNYRSQTHKRLFHCSVDKTTVEVMLGFVKINI